MTLLNSSLLKFNYRWTARSGPVVDIERLDADIDKASLGTSNACNGLNLELSRSGLNLSARELNHSVNDVTLRSYLAFL